MINIRRKVPVFAALALAFTLSMPAFGAEAQTFVEGTHKSLTELVTNAKSSADQSKLDQAFDAAFDYDSLAKSTLPDWDKRSPAERDQFTAVLKDLVRNAYRRNLKKTLGYKVDYVAEEDAEGGKAKVVRTTAKNTKNAREEPVSIDYLVHQVNGNLQIFDIVTEGSSLARNYRNQFRKVIEKHSFEELLKRMKAKRDKGGEAG